MTRLAILAGQGSLPKMIAAAHPKAVFVHFTGVNYEDLPSGDLLEASFEKFGQIFADLHANGITEVVFAGGLARPALNPANFDAKSLELAPRFMAAMAGGDDGLLRAVIAAFEEEGFRVLGAHDLVAGLTAKAGHLAGPDPSKIDLSDIERARAILAALGPLDVGQGVVVADGQALGVETAQGTDAMLGFVAQTPEALRHRAKGVLVKQPKPGQDLRVDMPAIGPDTIASAAKAGLSGIMIAADQVLLIEREATIAAAQDAGLFLRAEAI